MGGKGKRTLPAMAGVASADFETAAKMKAILSPFGW